MSYGKRPVTNNNQTAPAALQNKFNNLTLTNNTTVGGKVNVNTTMAPDQEALLAKERDLKFKIWLQNKSIKDKAFEYLAKLDSDRARGDESLVEVGIAIAAIERMLGVDDAGKRGADTYEGTAGIGEGTMNDNTSKKEPSASNRKTLKSAWVKWAMEHHSFSMLILTDEDLLVLSEAVKEFLFSEADLVASSSGDIEEINRANKTKNILPSLKYFFPAVPKPNEKPRPLTNDQKAQNAIFMRELRKMWRRVKEELNNRIIEFVAKALKTSPRGGGREEYEREEKERKYKSSEASLSQSGGDYYDSSSRNAKALEAQVLNDLSLKRLKEWIEEDEDKKNAEENENALQKLKEAKVSHEQFVRKKDGLRIRMPENLTAPKQQGMSYGREMTGIKATTKGARTTVELMAGSGLKYVHATTKKGLGGGLGDLEKSREMLLKLGHVHKENFDKDKLDEYEEEKRNNAVIVEKKKLEDKVKEDNTRAYEDWLQQKELKDQALHCLKLLEKPFVDYSDYLEDYDNNLPVYSSMAMGSTKLNTKASLRLSVGGGGFGTGGVRRSMNSTDMSRVGGTGNTVVPMGQTPPNMAHFRLTHLLDDHEDVLNYVIDVGKALKKVDRTLFTDWVKWCDAVIPTQIATMLWDYFHPIACDVHSTGYSQVRATFLKLLKPGKDYKEVFIEFVERTVFSKRIERIKTSRGYYRFAPEEKDDFDKEMKELRKEWMVEVAITKPQFTDLLATLGIVLKKQELNALFDAFDANHDGVLTLVEFLDFCGPKRDKSSGNAFILNQRCCWLTTCKITGMPNGYSISNPTTRLLKQNEEMKEKEKQTSLLSKYYQNYRREEEEEKRDKEREAEEENYKLNTMKFTGKAEMRKLANGELRMCVELKERQKREDMLRKMGLLSANPAAAAASSSSHKNKKSTKGKKDTRRGGEDDYEDDYEQDYEQDDEPHYEDHDEAPHRGGDKSVRGSKTGTLSKPNDVTEPCSQSTWTLKQRKEGLKVLMDMSKEAREEELLQSMLSNGKPPNPPKFWIRTRRIARNKLMMSGQGNNNSRSGTFQRFGSRGRERGGADSRERDRSSSRQRRSDTEGEDDGDYYDRDREDEDFDEGEEEGDLTTQLTLHWAPGEKSELVSFYSIEYGGAVTTTKKKSYEMKYYEVFRDPEDADINRTFSFHHTIRDLSPGTSYIFRIRAFNGFGPGEYTYKTFTTLTTAPPLPRIMKLTSDTVTLQWAFSRDFFQRIEELKAIFSLADKDRSGQVDREELTAIFDDKVDESEALFAFLKSIAVGKGIDLRQGFGALFDLMEMDDDGGLSWQEFQNFFIGAGWSADVGAVANQNSVATGKPLTSASTTLVVRPGDIVYVVEKCESEFDDVHREVLRTTLGYGTITRLEPGQSYRLRVFSLNADEVPGPKSPDIIVHTLLETPAPPTPVPKTILARQMTLTWKARNYITSTRHQAFIDKMVGDWAHSHNNDNGVSIEQVFAKYDANHSGDIDKTEFAKVLEDLSIPVTEERLFQAFRELDVDNSGTISFDEFAAWWRSDSVSYVLKRSEEILPSSNLVGGSEGGVGEGGNEEGGGVKGGGGLATSRSQSRGRYSTNTALNMSAIPEEVEEQRSKVSAQNSRLDRTTASRANSTKKKKPLGKQVGVPITSYRGTKTRSDVAGLTPNSLYHFKLRYVGARSNSILSPPLAIMTAPLSPSTPALIDVTSNTVRVKWYPSEFGAYKFAVHMRPVVAMKAQLSQPSGTTRRSATVTIVGQDIGEDGWIAVYNGPDNFYTCTTLSTESSYEVRVCAVNFQGTLSEPSPSLVFTTLPRNDTSNVITTKNVSSLFTVECTGDICVGDVILITERLFLRPKASEVVVEATNNAVGGGAGGGAANTARSASRGKTRPSSASATKAVNVNVGASVTSLRSTMTSETNNDGFVSINPSANAQFIGERTFAAIVTKDNYRSTRDVMASRNITIDKDYKQFTSLRKVWLEIIWQKSSTNVPNKYELKPGEILERFQNHLEFFEVFRCPWRHETARKSLKQEWEVLKDCFIDVDVQQQSS